MATKRKTSGAVASAKKKRQAEDVAALTKIAEEADRWKDFEDQQREDEIVASPMQFGVLSRTPEIELGKRLQEAREAKGLTQSLLADRTKLADADGKGLSRAVISLYEAGTNRPGPKELRLICEVLRITPSFLIYGTDAPFDNLSDFERYGGHARSDAEFYAHLTYCFTRLHHHHRVAMMDLMLGLLRGWNKGFDEQLHAESATKFLELSDDLRLILAKRKQRG